LFSVFFPFFGFSQNRILYLALPVGGFGSEAFGEREQTNSKVERPKTSSSRVNVESAPSETKVRNIHPLALRGTSRALFKNQDGEKQISRKEEQAAYREELEKTRTMNAEFDRKMVAQATGVETNVEMLDANASLSLSLSGGRRPPTAEQKLARSQIISKCEMERFEF
jgi:hypothetical protein